MSDTQSSDVHEGRRHSRHLCNGFAEVIVLDPDCLFRGEIRDVSQSGCFIATRARIRLKPKAEAEIRFKLNNREFRAQGRIMNLQHGSGVGFEFFDLNSQTEQKIASLIEEMNAAASDKNV